MIALARYGLWHAVCLGGYRPDKEVNEMLAPLVNQGRHRPVIEIIKTATDQRKSFAGKVDHRRREIELCVQPWFNGVLVGRSDVSEMVRHKRTDMTGDELRRQELIGPRSLQSRHQVQSDDRSKNDSSRETEAGET